MDSFLITSTTTTKDRWTTNHCRKNEQTEHIFNETRKGTADYNLAIQAMLVSHHYFSVCLVFTTICFTSSTKSIPRTIARPSFDRLSTYQLMSGTMLTTLLLSASQAKAQDAALLSSPYSLSAQLTNPQYTKRLFNIPPGAAQYPSSFQGLWSTSYKFVDAKFDPTIPMKELAKDVNVAGFRKYSVAFIPDVGKDFSCRLQFKKGGKGIVEDRVTDLVHPLNTLPPPPLLLLP